MHQHRYGACFVGIGHLFRIDGEKPLFLCQGEPGGTGDAGAGCYQS